MPIHQTLDQLDQMNLSGMAAALREQLEQTQYLELSFEDRIGLVVDREMSWRESRRLASRLKSAKLRHQATVEDIDFRAPRGLDRSVILSLAQADWVTAHHNVLVSGATGCGKSYRACAPAQAAIRQGHTALYARTPRLLDDRAISRGDGRYHTLLGQLSRASLLVLDDFLLTRATVEQSRDLLEVIEDRAQLRSTSVASQLPVEMWHEALSGPILADAIRDRLVSNAYRLALKGPSMRRREPPTGTPPGAAGGDQAATQPVPAPSPPRPGTTRR